VASGPGRRWAGRSSGFLASGVVEPAAARSVERGGLEKATAMGR
jgi:hypothetical protein